MENGVAEDEQDVTPQDAELDAAENAAVPQDSGARRRREQQALFDAWYDEQAATTDFSTAKRSAKQQHNDALEMESIRELLNKDNSERIMGSEHEFQIALFEQAKQQNTIAVADTGTGKTLIAVNLMKWVIDQEIDARAAGQPRKIAFFLVRLET